MEGLRKILENFTPRLLNPDDPVYKAHWRELRSKMIMGVWVEQFGKWRYVPGRLGFYGVFARFEDWAQDEYGGKLRTVTTPKIRDLEWHRSYYTLECDGFSGWSDDDQYTSDEEILNPDLKKMFLSEQRQKRLLTPSGKFKEFISPRDNLFMLHDEPKGYPMYYNENKNHVEMGTRGGGKSYWTALGEVLYDLCFDGSKYYLPGKPFPKSVAAIEITAGNESKSIELIDKVVFGMKALGEDMTVGVYSTPGAIDYEPCPFWKRMTGSVNANNQKDPWINEYDIKVGNRWTTGGTGSKLLHTVYSDNSKVGGQKSAGGRRTRVIHEEIGLNRHLRDAWGTNEGMITADGTKQASQKGIGTSGNIELVGPAKGIFTNPKDYNCLSFSREDSEYCFFIPDYMVNMKFKDEDGNTNVEAAQEYSLKLYLEKSKASNPQVLTLHRMNYPREIEDMWLSSKGAYLPIQEAEARERELLKGNLYEKLGTAINLYWEPTGLNGVNYEIILNPDPILSFPFEPDRNNFEGCVMMYIHPKDLMIGATIPNDMVIMTHDPYVSDDLEDGGSIGVTHVFVNPKYTVFGKPGNCLAATYIAKPSGGTKAYNETLEKLVAFYGNPVRGLWYEANRGDKLRAHFLKNNKLSLLCLRPQYVQGQFIYEKKVTETGFNVANNIDKKALLDSLKDWLLEEHGITGLDGQIEMKRNIERIPCLFTLRQIRMYDINKNFDAVSSMLALPLALGEREHREDRQRNKAVNPFAKVNTALKQAIR